MNKVEHVFVCAAEEAGEVASSALTIARIMDEIANKALAVSKTVSKTLRFGQNHNWPSRNMSNIEALVEELNDLEAIVEMLHDMGVDLTGLHDRADIEKKKAKVERYMMIADEGVITD